MPDDISSRSWREAFAALPQEQPPAQGWERVSTRLDRSRRRNRLPAWIGLAAAAALALVMVWPGTPDVDVEPSHARLPGVAAKTDVGAAEAAKPTPHAIAASAAPTSAAPTAEPSMARLYRLYAESAQLEALLALVRDDRVSSAGAVLLGDELDAQVAAIDASLARTDLDDGERLRLWQARVDALRQAAGFESTQRLLASQGRGEMMLVSVD